MEYVLETKALCKQYKHFKALNNLNMHVPKGSIYGFVGRNGAGKTTLIRLITGLQAPTAGEFFIYGKSNLSPHSEKLRRHLGAVVETPSIYLDMTAEDNLKLQFNTLGIPSFDEIPGLLQLVGLSDTGKKKARNFSLGMRQRLGIAIALSGKPDFLILDEPVNGLDPQGIIEIRELILKLNKELGITFLISSHILDELSKLATHYGFIDDGHLLKEISAADLENSCKKKTIATVSSTNVFARVLDKKNADYLVLDDNNVEIYTEIPVSELVNAANNENCTIVSLKEVEESLESFYMNLMGGGRND